MGLKLTVLAGAKRGTAIPLKKEEFTIGRSSECTLRAGSGAISRKHCAIVRKDSSWLVRDLGSRNGTHLNDQLIEKPTELRAGDELRVGPLLFLVEQIEPAEQIKTGKSASPPAEKSPSKKPQDVKHSKQPSAQEPPDPSASEDDISRWLIEEELGPQTMRETQTISMEETKTFESEPKQAEELADTPPEETHISAEATETKVGGSGAWGWFKKGKSGIGDAKKKPGKLPQIEKQVQSKDSRDAAADILRDMTRRR